MKRIFKFDLFVANLNTMPDLKKLDLPALIDLLADYNAAYTKMLTEGNTGENFTAYKKTIRLLQSEIESRKLAKNAQDHKA